MELIHHIGAMVSIARQLRADGKRIGFVPTMGALHRGHLSLMTHARSMCDSLIVSIFVNPTQFGPHEDYTRYPRDLKRDAELALTQQVDLIFAPTVEEMYPQGASTFVTVGELSDTLEGASRPGHFRGVATVVSKLFHVVQPHMAFFGQKDAQQVIVIKRMVRDLAMDVEIVVCPTVREADGLALSSRNVYLSPEERNAATVLYRALEHCRASYASGEHSASKLISSMVSRIQAEPLARIDYIAITDTNRLDPVEVISADQTVLVSLAVFVGVTRLIDNIVLNGEL